ncbi:sigma-70 family RNA polymerase sigma factor [uncultured Aquimarina sp.]|uniref:RNA polymerase sigma factor n=1 Tax=uncultured Aquimarina sp. TaxID=575652 RepID=UPI00262F1F57|nr:sigma-70 family RNA polymerase sigma factor [uncultured Aquimarina sp.]
MNTTKNKQIMEGIISGDRIVLKSFYKKNLPPVRKLILQYKGTTEDVEDIFQEALILLYNKLHSGDLELHQPIYLYFIGICKNLWRNQLRKQRILEHQEFQIDKIIDPSLTVMDRINQRHQQAVYDKHFTRLNNNSKNVLRLFFEGKSIQDIASNIGCTEGYTRKKKFLIKEHLFRMIQSDPIYHELVFS